MSQGTHPPLSRFKIYISQLLADLKLRRSTTIDSEITEFKNASNNIGSVITTNYDCFIENTLGFSPVVGNDIFLTNPYGAVYKIHGCVNDISKIVITDKDYEKFDDDYKLIQAQLISLFIHNPIIFIGYKISDVNIKKVLKTIFSYIPINTEIANKVKANFLLIDYEKNSTNINVSSHELDIDGTSITINTVKTDDFKSIFNAISSLTLSITVQDLRKVKSVFRDIEIGESKLKVQFAENLDNLKNCDKVLAIGNNLHVFDSQLGEMTIGGKKITLDESILDKINFIREGNFTEKQGEGIPTLKIVGELKEINSLDYNFNSNPNDIFCLTQGDLIKELNLNQYQIQAIIYKMAIKSNNKWHLAILQGSSKSNKLHKYSRPLSEVLKRKLNDPTFLQTCIDEYKEYKKQNRLNRK